MMNKLSALMLVQCWKLWVNQLIRCDEHINISTWWWVRGMMNTLTYQHDDEWEECCFNVLDTLSFLTWLGHMCKWHKYVYMCMNNKYVPSVCDTEIHGFHRMWITHCLRLCDTMWAPQVYLTFLLAMIWCRCARAQLNIIAVSLVD